MSFQRIKQKIVPLSCIFWIQNHSLLWFKLAAFGPDNIPLNSYLHDKLTHLHYVFVLDPRYVTVFAKTFFNLVAITNKWVQQSHKMGICQFLNFCCDRKITRFWHIAHVQKAILHICLYKESGETSLWRRHLFHHISKQNQETCVWPPIGIRRLYRFARSSCAFSES